MLLWCFQVHERDINTDFLLIILKKLLTFRPDLKVSPLLLLLPTIHLTVLLNMLF